MTRRMDAARRAAGLVVGLTLAAAGCSGGSSGHAASASATHLNGLFRIAPGACPTGTGLPTGSYLVVISAASSSTVRNHRGGCKNPAYTLLRPGVDGGIRTGEFQQVSGSAFDHRGDSRDDRIIVPTRFGKTRFGFATSAQDEQDAPSGNPAFPRPAAVVTGTSLKVDLRSLVVTYGGQPGSTCASSFGVGCWELGSESASGTYDAATHHFSIEWFSGESFTAKGDSIEVHLEGTFVPHST